MASTIEYHGRWFETMFADRPNSGLTVLEVSELGDPAGLYFEIELPMQGELAVSNVEGSLPVGLVAIAVQMASGPSNGPG